ncbi:hypothetical protein EDD15DRAFT_2307670 [Pisolithus albus]|nr:hypothetical protein EDD15DRAFT_2307670 [Pisolithus albus]
MGCNYQSTGQRFDSDCDSEATYVASETDSLKDPGSTRRMSTRSWILVAALILGLPLFFETTAHMANQCPLSYEARDRMGAEWQKEAQVQESLRREWQREEEEHWHKREQWKWEVEEHERLERERREQEKRERQKMDMFWERGYTAYLANLPIDYPNRIEACKETQLEIHGGSYFPKHREDLGAGIVMGRWEFNHNEPDCVPFWNWFKDKGCTSEGSGKRRFEHYLEYLPYGGDWREFCATTPVSFHGMHFPGAEICFQQDGGTYGHWEVEDSTC